VIIDDQHPRAHVHMLAVSGRARIVASPNRLPAKSRSTTESRVRAAPFSRTRCVPRVVVLMQFDQRRHMPINSLSLALAAAALAAPAAQAHHAPAEQTTASPSQRNQPTHLRRSK
jgi:hypothetical protein